MSKTGTENLGDSSLGAAPTYLTDMGASRPATALSPETTGGKWRTLPYETDELSGVMLIGGTEACAPDVTLPLGVSGWHAVSLGVFGGYHEPDQVLARLTGDDTFTVARLQRHQTTPWYRQYAGEPIWEIFWKVADLTNRDLVIGQQTWRVAPGDGPGSHKSVESMVAYVKLVPLSDAELSEHQADLKRSENRRLFTHNDAGVHSQLPTTAEEIRRNLEEYRDTDFSRIYWEAGYGDKMNYFSEVGSVRPSVSEDYYDGPGQHITEESWRILGEKGIDPFGVALEYAHEIGLEFHAGLRVSGFNFPPPYDHVNRGPSFFRNHPELRGTDRSGRPNPRLAYTYPETRRYVLSLLRDFAAKFPVDGISLLFNRRLPVVDYEPPLVEGFKAEFGKDPRQIDEKDPRWLQYRSGIMTEFMRQVRAAMDEVAEDAGRDSRIGVSAMVTNTRDENLYYGLDMDTWVKEGLVDTLIPYSSNPNFNSNDPSWEDVGDAEYWVSLTKGTATELALNIMPRQMSAEEYRRRVAPLYEAGVEHFYFWDGAMGRAQNSGASHVMRRLGHKEEISDWVEAGEPSLAAPQMWLRRLGDWDFSYVSPG